MFRTASREQRETADASGKLLATAGACHLVLAAMWYRENGLLRRPSR